MLRILSVVSLAITLVACSQSGEDSEAASAEKDHAWKAQTDALKAARDVENVIHEGAERKDRALEESSR